MNKFYIIAVAALVLSCGQNPAKQEKAPALMIERTPIVAVAKATKADVKYISNYSSTVQAYAINNIVGQTAGRIKTLNVEIGDFVKEGQILAELDQAQLDQAALRLNNDKIELERIKALYEQGGVSQSDYESLVLAYNVSKRSYDNLVENTILCAPINGVVTARNYDKGDMYAMSSPIYTVQQISPVKILVAISESDYSKVKKGDNVKVSVDALPEKVFNGKISRIYPVLDPTTHTFSAEVNIDNNYNTLRPGMFARVALDMGTNNSIVLPDQAVVKQQGSGDRGVFILKSDNTVELRIVKIGLHFDTNYEILSGVNEGETVVVKGGSTLKNGDKVEVER